MIQRFKVIHCKQCGIECKSGHRGLCGSCYAKAQKEKVKYNLKKQKAKERIEKKRNEKALTKTEMLKLVQKLARYVDGDYCCTCNKRFSASLQKQGGHGIRSAKANSTAYLLINIHAQCSLCNGVGSGEQYLYAKFVDKKYGQGTFDFLHQLSNVVWKPTKEDLYVLRKKAEEYISLAENSSPNEREKLRNEFIQWQYDQSWYKELIKKIV